MTVVSVVHRHGDSAPLSDYVAAWTRVSYAQARLMLLRPDAPFYLSPISRAVHQAHNLSKYHRARP
jgi:hypothetical protein